MLVAFDTETKGFDWFDGQIAFLGTWATSDDQGAVDLTTEEGKAEFVAILDAADGLLAHNLPFDVHQIKATTGYDIMAQTWPEGLHDTHILARTVLPEGAGGWFKLKLLTKLLLDPKADEYEDAIKEMGKELGLKMSATDPTPGAYYEIWKAYPDVMEEYAIKDARFTYDLYQLLAGKLDDSNTPIYNLEMEVMRILIAAEDRGIAVDRSKVTELHKRYESELASTVALLPTELAEAMEGGPGSEKKLLSALEGLGVPLYKKSPKTGKLQTNKWALQEFENDFPDLKRMQEARTYQRFLSTYTSPMLDRDTVHASINQWEARTGRMSCSRPNMQNIPKRAGSEVREMFIPRDGHSFVVCDFDSIEVRLLAHYLNDPGYRQLINDGFDPHAFMAATVYGGDPQDYEKGTEGEKLRAIAKNTLFAILYGAGAKKVAMMNQMDEDAARALISKIKNSVPRYNVIKGRVNKKIMTQGKVRTIMGRVNIVPRDKGYVGLNSLIQGSAADIMKKALTDVAAVCEPYGAYPLMVVHDEVIIECPTKTADQLLPEVIKAMENSYPLNPALRVTGSVVHNNYAEAA